MNFPRLTFPLTVDFGDDGYWVGEQGPFKYGAAVTAFFIGEVSNDGIPLMRVYFFSGTGSSRKTSLFCGKGWFFFAIQCFFRCLVFHDSALTT